MSNWNKWPEKEPALNRRVVAILEDGTPIIAYRTTTWNTSDTSQYGKTVVAWKEINDPTQEQLKKKHRSKLMTSFLKLIK